MKNNQKEIYNVALIIREHISKSNLTTSQLQQRLGIKPRANIVRMTSGRCIFPFDLIGPITEALGIERVSFTKAVLRQHGSENSIEYIEKVLGSASAAQNPSPDRDAEDISCKSFFQKERLCECCEQKQNIVKPTTYCVEDVSGASEADIQFWRILKKAFRTGLSDRGISIAQNDLILAVRFMLEEIESSGLRVVPEKPTSQQHQAMKEALDLGKRRSTSWVGRRTKQRWRYQAAVDAAPSWRRGYEMDKKTEDEEPEE